MAEDIPEKLVTFKNKMSAMNGMSMDPTRMKNFKNSTGPAIMESLDSLSVLNRDTNPSLNSNSSQGHISLHGVNSLPDQNFKSFTYQDDRLSFLLIDGNEYLKISSSEQFLQKLNCPNKNQKVKVISIFGNTGDGKSHTLNHAIFKGREVFKTSSSQNSCTLGVWAAFDARLGVICLDTEGLLGFTKNEKVRTRLLLKTLAVSDIVVYRTRSERLHKDMFTFLGAASRAYSHYFQKALQAVGQKEGILSSVKALGPSIIIFQETINTLPLMSENSKSPEDMVRERFAQAQLEIEAFSSIKYVGIQTAKPPTNFQSLRAAIKNELRNTTVRSAREPHLVFHTLKILNDKFSGNIEDTIDILFPDQYFTCPVKCFSCGNRCKHSMEHIHENKAHASDKRCRYQHQYENKVLICKKCYSNGEEVIVTKRCLKENESSWYSIAQYVWSGYVIECPHCGEIYRSRQHWIGNSNPEDTAVRTEIIHVWALSNQSLTAQNTAQRVLDSVSYITDAVSSVSLQPTKTVSAWVADYVVNPSYWRPNSDILHCHKCQKLFAPTDTKHHCRACGEGFCDGCSSKVKEVPSRNWYSPVRVCDNCYELDNNSNEEVVVAEVSLVDDLSARKVSEHIVSTISAVGTVLNYSKAIIKDQARPTYWVPDSEIVNCCVCEKEFSELLLLHHCRACGRGVCEGCSPNQKPVPRRGWDYPVRVCNKCIKID